MKFRSFQRQPDGTYIRRYAKHIFAGLFPSSPAPAPPAIVAPPPPAVGPTGAKPTNAGSTPSLAGLAAATQQGGQETGKTLLGS